jgi:hypothetical protein
MLADRSAISIANSETGQRLALRPELPGQHPTSGVKTKEHQLRIWRSCGGLLGG